MGLRHRGQPSGDLRAHCPTWRIRVGSVPPRCVPYLGGMEEESGGGGGFLLPSAGLSSFCFCSSWCLLPLFLPSSSELCLLLLILNYVYAHRRPHIHTSTPPDRHTCTVHPCSCVYHTLHTYTHKHTPRRTHIHGALLQLCIYHALRIYTQAHTQTDTRARCIPAALYTTHCTHIHKHTPLPGPLLHTFFL